MQQQDPGDHTTFFLTFGVCRQGGAALASQIPRDIIVELAPMKKPDYAGFPQSSAVDLRPRRDKRAAPYPGQEQEAFEELHHQPVWRILLLFFSPVFLFLSPLASLREYPEYQPSV